MTNRRTSLTIAIACVIVAIALGLGLIGCDYHPQDGGDRRHGFRTEAKR